MFLAVCLGLSLTLLSGLSAPAFAEGALVIATDQENERHIRAIADEFSREYPDVSVEIIVQAPGAVRESRLRAFLSAENPPDLFVHIPGALLAAVQPERHFFDFSGQGWAKQLKPEFMRSARFGGKVLAAPIGSMMLGGIFYNREVYQRYGLEPPEDWAAFMKNVIVLKANGVTPVLQGHADAWTSQLITLADFHNLRQKSPDFAEDLTMNRDHYATNEAALRSFSKVEDLARVRAFNADAPRLGYHEVIQRLVGGEGGHFPMHTSLFSYMGKAYPEAIRKLGFFPVPPDEASGGGVTMWMPNVLVMPLKSRNKGEALAFLDIMMSDRGCLIRLESLAVVGPAPSRNCDTVGGLPYWVDDLIDVARNNENNTAALEFFTPLKGQTLEFLLIELMNGEISAEDAARAYDRDIRRRALSLRLPDWDLKLR